MTIQLKDLVLIRYKIREELAKVLGQIRNLKKVEDMADRYITYEGLSVTDMVEAKRFKKSHIDTLRTGLFNQKQKSDNEIKQLLLKYK